MILHTPSHSQDKTHQTADPSPWIWPTLVVWLLAPQVTPAVWFLIPKSREWLRKTPSPTSTSRLLQTLVFFSLLSLTTSTMTSQKHMYVMRGDNLVLDCTLLTRQPKANIDSKYSGHHSRPLPARTIISRNQVLQA